MKHKVVFMLVILLLISIALVIAVMDEDDFQHRYHQHEEVSTTDKTSLDFSEIETHLPVIRIETNGQKVPGSPIRVGGIRNELSESGDIFIETDFTLYEKDEKPLKETVAINYRGNSSRHFDKKSYAIRFIDEAKENKNISLLGMEADNNWSLNGPYIDRSLIRNYLALNWAGELMPYAPDTRFVEVFVNGEYDGVYVLMEKVSRGKGRVPISVPERGSNHTGYIVRLDRTQKMENMLNDFSMSTFKIYPSGTELRYPTEKENTERRQEFVRQDYSNIGYSTAQMPYNMDFDYESIFDIRALYDYFIINELFRLEDAGQYSTYFYRDLRGKLTPVVWDYNNGLNNYQDSEYNRTGLSMIHRIYYEELLRDKKFADGLIRRYRYLRETKLSTARMLQYVDDTVLFLGDAIERNNNRWGSVYDLSKYDTHNYLHPAERNMTSYEGAVDQVKDYLEKRAEWLDENIDTIYQYSHLSRIGHEAIK